MTVSTATAPWVIVLQPLHQISERLVMKYLHVIGIEDTKARKNSLTAFYSKEGN